MPVFKHIKQTFQLNKFYNFIVNNKLGLYCRLSVRYAKTCRLWVVCQTNLERIEYQVLFYFKL